MTRFQICFDSTPVRVYRIKRISRYKVFAGLAAYTFFPKKPPIKNDPVLSMQLAIF